MTGEEIKKLLVGKTIANVEIWDDGLATNHVEFYQIETIDGYIIDFAPYYADDRYTPSIIDVIWDPNGDIIHGPSIDRTGK